MKRKDIQQLKESSIESLRKLIAESQLAMNSLKSELYAGRLKNVKASLAERKKIAIAKTLIKEKETMEKRKEK